MIADHQAALQQCETDPAYKFWYDLGFADSADHNGRGSTFHYRKNEFPAVEADWHAYARGWQNGISVRWNDKLDQLTGAKNVNPNP